MSEDGSALSSQTLTLISRRYAHLPQSISTYSHTHLPAVPKPPRDPSAAPSDDDPLALKLREEEPGWGGPWENREELWEEELREPLP